MANELTTITKAEIRFGADAASDTGPVPMQGYSAASSDSAVAAIVQMDGFRWGVRGVSAGMADITVTRQLDGATGTLTATVTEPTPGTFDVHLGDLVAQ